MKTLISLQLVVMLLLAGVCTNCSRDELKELPREDKIVFMASPELYELTSEWAMVFSKLNPEANIKIVEASESGNWENLDPTAQLSFMTSYSGPERYDMSLWRVSIGREIIVPVINVRNPYIREIARQGVSPAGLARILDNPGYTSWGTIIDNGSDRDLHLYTTDDASLRAGLAGFMETDQLTFSEETMKESTSFVTSMQSDAYALGFCYLSDVVDPVTKELPENMQILPIDKNGNGRMDYKEDICASVDAFSRGVWIGKYPKKLVNNVYAVADTPPIRESEIAFLSWIIERGHVRLDNYGYGELPEFERLAQLKIMDDLRDGQPGPEPYSLPKEPGIFTGPLPYILALLLFLAMYLYYNIRLRKRIQEGLPVQESGIPGFAFAEDRLEVSPGLYYDKSHTWAYLEKDGTVKVGIDDFLQRVTGPLTRVKLKLPGERVKKGMYALSIIQDGKQLDICAPVTGTIKEQNTQLLKDSSLINSSPHADGWIYKIEPANWFKELQFLLMGNSYMEWLKKEFQRLKEFMTDTIGSDKTGYVHVLQDGGELKEHVLKDLGPEIWEDFQTNFMDVS